MNVSEFEGKIKSYFNEKSTNPGVSNEQIIISYFEDFRQQNQVDYEKLYKAHPKYEIDYEKDTKKSFINEQNQLIHFVHFKVINSN